MNKLSSVALTAALVVAGVGASVSAEAHPYFSVGIDLPRVAVVEPYGYSPGYAPGYFATPGYVAPYYYDHDHYYGHDRYWHRDYDRDRGERYHRGWDHEGGRRGDRR